VLIVVRLQKGVAFDQRILLLTQIHHFHIKLEENTFAKTQNMISLES